MRKLVGALVTVAASLALSPSPAQALSTHWGPWLLCNTAGNDYHVRVRVTPRGGLYHPSAFETRRADNAKIPPAYNDIEMDLYNHTGSRLQTGGYGVTRRTKAARVDFDPLSWKGTRYPQVQFRLWDNFENICATSRVAA